MLFLAAFESYADDIARHLLHIAAFSRFRAAIWGLCVSPCMDTMYMCIVFLRARSITYTRTSYGCTKLEIIVMMQRYGLRV